MEDSCTVCLRHGLVCRRAQRKFRERQKAKLAESEGRARQLEAALERLKLEKSALETRNALLEKMVGMRGEEPRPQPPPAAVRTEGTPLNVRNQSHMRDLLSF